MEITILSPEMIDPIELESLLQLSCGETNFR